MFHILCLDQRCPIFAAAFVVGLSLDAGRRPEFGHARSPGFATAAGTPLTARG